MRNRTPILRFSVPFLAAGIALGLKLLLDPIYPIGEKSPFLMFYGAVTVSAWFGGLGPGLLTAVLGTVLVDFFFFEPKNTPFQTTSLDSVRLCIFFLESSLISLLCDALHKVRRRAEDASEALQESEERFRGIFNQAAVGIAQEGLDGRWLVVNQKMCEITGYTREDLLGKTFQDITHPDDLPKNLQKFRELEEGRIGGFSMEKRYLKKDGSTVWVNLTMSPMRDSQGRPTHGLSVVEDISDRKRAEEEIRLLNDTLERRVAERTAQLQEANRELESFSYSVSHDLRAPIRHMDGFAELLAKHAGGALDEKGVHYLKTIQETAKYAGNLVDELLAFSRMGRSEMQRDLVDVDLLVKEVRRELEMEAEGRRIDWKVGSFPPVRADRAMLRLALRNLLSNAVKYTRRREKAEIEVGSRPGEGEVILFVRDNGAGFDMRYAGKLFGIFQRLHHAEDFEGTGIGLANVRRIIARHGGRTWAEGAIDGGAAFFISLPVSKERDP